MLKDRGHKGSWKGSGNPNRLKKKSYGNIHSVKDRGIYEIETAGGSNPTSPWSSPLMGRKSVATIAPQLDKVASKLLPMAR